MDVHALVVDDSGIMRKMVMRSLKEADLAKFTFTEACDGLDALEKFNPQTMNMLFVDWNMPNMSGIEFVTKIRQSNTEIPVVMITTEGTIAKIDEAFENGSVNGYVVKPFTPDVLKAKLEPLFDELAKSKKKSKGFFQKLASKMS